MANIEIEQPTLVTDQLMRQAFVNGYNKGSASSKRHNTIATSGEIVALARLQFVNLLTPEEQVLTDAEQNAIMLAKLSGLKDGFIAAYDWLLDAEIFAYAGVPVALPGVEKDATIESRQWKWMLNMNLESGRRAYNATMREPIKSGVFVCVAFVKLDQIFTGSEGAQLIADVISQNAVIEDCELIGQTLLPSSEVDFTVRCESRLRCEAIHAEVEIEK